MPIHISGDTLALDKKIRSEIETEAHRFEQRFAGTAIDARARITEEFDALHGHRVRCELRADLGGGRQIVVREARKDPFEAIREAFGTARRNLRKIRRRPSLATPPASQVVVTAPAP
jgi:ribosome-associated translation inhibitor RaiA